MNQFISKLFDVRRGEKIPVLLGSLFFFFVMAALMAVRPARETLGMDSGIEKVRWMFIGTAVVTLAVNPAFGWLVSRYRRISFISTTYAVFAVSLVGFWALLIFSPRAVGETTGQVIYVWYSVFNLFAVMVCWALLADRFSLDQSKRFFGLVSAGGTLGAIAGPALSSVLAERLGTPALLLLGAGFLILAIATAWALVRVAADQQNVPAGHEAKRAEKAVIGGNAWAGFSSVLRSGYLLSIALYILLLAIVLTFIYFTRMQMVKDLGYSRDASTALFARLDMITQITTLVVQLSLTGYLIKRFGVSVSMALLPLTVLLGFVGLAIVASLATLVILDAGTKAVQRAIMRPARETLFTVLSREDKYKAKAFIDTFVYRGGDVIGAQVDGLIKSLSMGLLALSGVVIPLSIGWTFLGIWLGRQQVAKAGKQSAEAKANAARAAEQSAAGDEIAAAAQSTDPYSPS